MPRVTGKAVVRNHSIARRRSLAALLLCAVATAAAGCGANGERFTSAEADRALAQLDAIQQFVDEGRCATAQRRVALLIAQAAKVNRDRQDLGAAYARSAKRLQQLVSRECVEIKEASPTAGGTAATGATGQPQPTPEPSPAPQPTPEQTGGGAPPSQNPGGNDNGGGGNNGGGNNGGNGGGGNSGGASPG